MTPPGPLSNSTLTPSNSTLTPSNSTEDPLVNVALLSLAFDTEIRRYRRKKENVYLLIVYFQKLIRNFLGHVLAFN